MIRKLALWSIWISFVAYTVWLDPLHHPATVPIVKNLLTGQWHQVNPILAAIFSLMGVWPLVYACLMFADGRMQRIPAWPYFLGSNGTGVICLLPYLGLRAPSSEFIGEKDLGLKILDSRWTGVSLSLATIGLCLYAGLGGDWPAFVQEWRTLPFVHLITIDFCLMGLIFPLSTLLQDDMARRGLHAAWIFWAVALVPLFGPLTYLCLRPPLPEASWTPATPTAPQTVSMQG